MKTGLKMNNKTEMKLKKYLEYASLVAGAIAVIIAFIGMIKAFRV